MKSIKRFLPLLIVFLLVVSCSPQSPAVETQSPQEEGYPIQPGETGYPVYVPVVEGESGYPADAPTPFYEQGPEFSIDEPLQDGDTLVTGTGPAGVPIRLVSVSEVGLTLGETIIEQDGKFTFTLNEPLKSGHTIGIQLGDIAGTDLDPNDFLYSETYYERPLVGILFDLVVIQ